MKSHTPISQFTPHVSQNSQHITDSTTHHFGASLHLPVDDPSDWPDLRYRDATDEELTALRLKLERLREIVKVADQDLEEEERVQRADPDWLSRADRVPYIPGSIISLIHIELSFAQRVLEARGSDEVAAAHLRLCETLVRQLLTWRGEGWKGVSHLADTTPIVKSTCMEKNEMEGFVLPRFIVLEPPERTS